MYRMTREVQDNVLGLQDRVAREGASLWEKQYEIRLGHLQHVVTKERAELLRHSKGVLRKLGVREP
jgi:hypothetical protein